MASLIWVFTSLCSLVGYQIALPCEAFVTMDALIWFLPSVCSLVSGQTTLTCKTLFTMTSFGMVYTQCVIFGGLPDNFGL